MKREELLKEIKNAAKRTQTSFEFVRHGGSHDLYPYGGQLVTVPRHREINEQTARAILRDLGIR